ncbi:hypothetical protein ACQ9AP_25390, partial [Escherichia coli]
TVISSGNTQKEEYNRLQSEHEQGNKEFDKAKKEEEYRQSAIPLDAGEAKENIDKLKNEMIKRSDF